MFEKLKKELRAIGAKRWRSPSGKAKTKFVKLTRSQLKALIEAQKNKQQLANEQQTTKNILLAPDLYFK